MVEARDNRDDTTQDVVPVAVSYYLPDNGRETPPSKLGDVTQISTFVNVLLSDLSHRPSGKPERRRRVYKRLGVAILDTASRQNFITELSLTTSDSDNQRNGIVSNQSSQALPTQNLKARDQTISPMKNSSRAIEEQREAHTSLLREKLNMIQSEFEGKRDARLSTQELETQRLLRNKMLKKHKDMLKAAKAQFPPEHQQEF